jgi:hypothetical protein
VISARSTGLRPTSRSSEARGASAAADTTRAYTPHTERKEPIERARAAIAPLLHPMRRRTSPVAHRPVELTAPLRGGCRANPSRKSRSPLAEVHARAAVRDDPATDPLRVTEEMAVFRAHP